MKNILKRSLAAVATLAVAATCMGGSIVNADYTNNLAKEYGTAYDGNYSGNYYGSVSNLNDGDTSTHWQTTDKADGLYVGIDFAVAAQVDKIVINVGSFTSVDSVVSNGYTITYNNGTEWVAAPTPVESESEITVTFSEATAFKGVRMDFTQFNNWAPRIYEIYVLGSLSTTDIAKSALVTAIDAAKALDECIYTTDSWAALETALTEGEALLSDTQATADAITAKASEIDALRNALVKSDVAPAKEALKTALAYANGLSDYSYKYSNTAALAISAAVAKAETVYNSGSFVASDYTDAATALTAATNVSTYTNLSLNQIGFASTKHSGWADHNKNDILDDITVMVDGDVNTRWQAGVRASNEAPQYAGVKYAEKTAINTVALYGEGYRISVDTVTVKYTTQDLSGEDWMSTVEWTELQGVTRSSEKQLTINGRNDYYLTVFEFPTTEVTAIALFYTGDSGEASAREIETYNRTAELGMNGAQIRENALDKNKYDLRFITNFSAELYAKLDTITDIGVVMVREDQLLAAGKTTADINVDLEAEGLEVKKISATYLRNVDLETTGNYTYTVTILGIGDTSVKYVCVGYCTTANGTIYTEAMTRSVADGLK